MIPWCESSPCKNGGKCWQSGTNYTCECKTGWTGLYCDVSSVSCEVAARQRGMMRFTCRIILFVFLFKFMSSVNLYNLRKLRKIIFEKATKSVLSPPLLAGVDVAHLCHNSGRCLDVKNVHYCHCQAGYTGSYCEEQVDECTPNPCQNGATCTDFLGGYSCKVTALR